MRFYMTCSIKEKCYLLSKSLSALRGCQMICSCMWILKAFILSKVATECKSKMLLAIMVHFGLIFGNYKFLSKSKTFFWRACTNCLPTITLLRRRRVPIEESCPVYFGYNESVIHVLLECSLAWECWDLIALGPLYQGTNSFLG